MKKGDSFTSLPTGIPLPRLAVSPMTLAMKALRVRYSFRTTPLRMVFNSGIPEPGRGEKKKQSGGDEENAEMSGRERQTDKSGLKAERSEADR